MDISSFGITGVASITAICFLVAEIIKATKLNKKWIPPICGILGGVMGPIAMKIIPSFPASDMLTAVAVGIVSGLSATGMNQRYKQLARREPYGTGNSCCASLFSGDTWWFFLRCISFKQANKLSNPAIRKKGRKAQ